MHTRLLLPIVFIVLECLMCIRNVAGYFIHVDAHAEECFFDRVTSGTKLSLMFEVAEGGFLDIDVKVRVMCIPKLRTPPLVIFNTSVNFTLFIAYSVIQILDGNEMTSLLGGVFGGSH